MRGKIRTGQDHRLSAQTVGRLFSQRNAWVTSVEPFSRRLKDDAVEVPFETLKAICEAVSIPVIAIGGGITNNVKELSSGICGIAVISALRPERRARKLEELKTATKEMVRR